MRAHWACVLLGSLAVLMCGCGPGGRPDLIEGKTSFRRAGWFRVVSQDGSIVGYVERCRYSSRHEREISFVYNTRLVRVGFVTPRRVVYRYLRDGSSRKVGLFPEEGVESALLGVPGPLKLLKPDK